MSAKTPVLRRLKAETLVRSARACRPPKYPGQIFRLQAKAGFTEEASDDFDRYQDLAGHDLRTIELFNFNPSA
jgi:hypothetical protein